LSTGKWRARVPSQWGATGTSARIEKILMGYLPEGCIYQPSKAAGNEANEIVTRHEKRLKFGSRGKRSPALVDERTNLVVIDSLDLGHLSWRQRREIRSATVLNHLIGIFSARDGASYGVEH